MNSFREVPSLLGNVYLARKKSFAKSIISFREPHLGLCQWEFGQYCSFGQKGFCKIINHQLCSFKAGTILIFIECSLSSYYEKIFNIQHFIHNRHQFIILDRLASRNPDLATKHCKMSYQQSLPANDHRMQDLRSASTHLSSSLRKATTQSKFEVVFLYFLCFVFVYFRICICVFVYLCFMSASSFKVATPQSKFSEKSDLSFSGKGNLCHFYRASPPAITTILVKKTILVSSSQFRKGGFGNLEQEWVTKTVEQVAPSSSS